MSIALNTFCQSRRPGLQRVSSLLSRVPVAANSSLHIIQQLVHASRCSGPWIVSPFGLQPGKGVSSDTGLPIGNGDLREIRSCCKHFLRAKPCVSDAQCPALSSAKARACFDDDTAHKCFDVEGLRSSQHGGVKAPSWKGAQTLLYSQNAESIASEYLLSYLLTTLV